MNRKKLNILNVYVPSFQWNGSRKCIKYAISTETGFKMQQQKKTWSREITFTCNFKRKMIKFAMELYERNQWKVFILNVVYWNFYWTRKLNWKERCLILCSMKWISSVKCRVCQVPEGEFIKFSISDYVHSINIVEIKHFACIRSRQLQYSMTNSTQNLTPWIFNEQSNWCWMNCVWNEID